MVRLHQYPFKEEYIYHMLQALKLEKKDAFRRDFLHLHPADQTDFFLELDKHRRLLVYTFLLPTEFGEIFSRLEPMKQRRCMLELEHSYSISMLQELNHSHSLS